MRGSRRMASLMRRENSTRSTARACPAGTALASAQASNGEPARRISCFRSQGAVFSLSDLSELEQTSSPKSGLVRGRRAHGAHFVEVYIDTETRCDERSFGAGESSADDADATQADTSL